MASNSFISFTQQPSESGNTDPWLAEDQSRDLNNEYWLAVYLISQEWRETQNTSSLQDIDPRLLDVIEPPELQFTTNGDDVQQTSSRRSGQAPVNPGKG